MKKPDKTPEFIEQEIIEGIEKYVDYLEKKHRVEIQYNILEIEFLEIKKVKK